MSKMSTELEKRLDVNKYPLLETAKGFAEFLRDTRNRQWASCYAEQLERKLWRVINAIEKG